MNTMLSIRTTVFAITQREMADIAGVTQATVSRWEAGHWEPNRDELARIRNEAVRRKLKWKDGLFFAAPSALPAVHSSVAS